MATRASLTVVSGTVVTSAWGNSIRDHVVPYSGAADGITDGMLSVNTSADQLRIGNGSTTVQFGCYGATLSTWDLTGFPEITQSGAGMNGTVTQNNLTRYGRHVKGGGIITIDTGTGVAGTVIQINTTLPVVTTTQTVGDFLFTDASGGFYVGVLTMDTSSRLLMWAHNETNSVGASPSFAATAGDIIRVNLDYFAGSAT